MRFFAVFAVEKMKKINLLHLIQGLEIGGLEIMVVNLLERLDHSRYRPSICCYDSLGSLSQGLPERGIGVHLLRRRPGIDYLYPFKLARHLRKSKINILHLHNPTALFYGTLAGKIARTTCIIYTEHGRDFSSSIKVKIANGLLCKMLDRVVAVAECGKKYLVEHEGVDERRIFKIYNGIDSQKFGRTHSGKLIRRELGITDDQPVIGIVARLDPIKNHACLIRAMKIIVTSLSRTVLLIIGDGALRSELEGLTADLGLQNHVKFLGARSDIPELLSVMDVFVLSSFSEGLSLTLIEACAAARPIVATNVGGNAEIVEHESNGLLVPSDQPEVMANAIAEILNDKKKARLMGEKGRKKFEKGFTLDVMVKRYEALYGSCLCELI
uniref:D-inositol-3-phosphate glycosyltransferase n=2 Tax=Candidatus Methanogaster sp. ANME-2c ERB4 TaxID=2759911 RepID=A0A7G9YFQ7_9EURY|nr:D-inositol-3-phosphate glycosyltransferase [Methanosarcinales archaeon ANME-2c ERB4]